MLALDQLTRAGRTPEQPDHGGAVAVLVQQDRGVADVVLRLVELLLGGVGLELQDRSHETEAVDVGLGRGQPFVGRRPPGRDVGERRVEALPFRLGYDKKEGSAVQVATRGANADRLPRKCAQAASK